MTDLATEEDQLFAITVADWAEFVAHAVVAFLLYVWIGLHYVLGTGIDSL